MKKFKDAIKSVRMKLFLSFRKIKYGKKCNMISAIYF